MSPVSFFKNAPLENKLLSKHGRTHAPYISARESFPGYATFLETTVEKYLHFLGAATKDSKLVALGATSVARSCLRRPPLKQANLQTPMAIKKVDNTGSVKHL
jgi:hypothetical protein